MNARRKHTPLAVEHFHTVNTETVRQTIEECELEFSIDMGTFIVHHGTRYGAPIVIAEHTNQQADELSGIWFDDDQ